MLFMRRLTQGQALDMAALDWVLLQSVQDIRQGLLEGKAKIPLAPIQDPRDPAATAQSRSLARLYRQYDLVWHEQGTRDLCVGYPFVRGMLADGTPIHGPLVLFPVHLHRTNTQWVLQVTDAPVVNVSLLLAMALSASVPAPSWVNEPEIILPDNGTHRELITHLYEKFKACDLDVQVPAHLMEDAVQPWQNLNRGEIEEHYKAGVLEMVPEMVLGMFAQADSYLHQDYAKLLASETSITDLFLPQEMRAGTSSSRFTYFPLPIDSSQWKVLTEVRKGQSMVVHGPPGSGKSQVISNLMADYLARGLKVALICQKRVALEVVHERLSALGISPWLAMVHDHKADRPLLYTQLAQQVGELENYQKQVSALEVQRQEEQLGQLTKQIEEVLKPLQELKDALYKDNASGYSVKELYMMLKPASAHAQSSNIWHQILGNGVALSLKQWHELGAQLSLWKRYWMEAAKAPQFLQEGRPSWAHFSTTDLRGLTEKAAALLKVSEALTSQGLLKKQLQVQYSVSGFVAELERVESFREQAAFLNLVQADLSSNQRLQGSVGKTDITRPAGEVDVPFWQSFLAELERLKDAVPSWHAQAHNLAEALADVQARNRSWFRRWFITSAGSWKLLASTLGEGHGSKSATITAWQKKLAEHSALVQDLQGRLRLFSGHVSNATVPQSLTMLNEQLAQVQEKVLFVLQGYKGQFLGRVPTADESSGLIQFKEQLTSLTEELNRWFPILAADVYDQFLSGVDPTPGLPSAYQFIQPYDKAMLDAPSWVPVLLHELHKHSLTLLEAEQQLVSWWLEKLEIEDPILTKAGDWLIEHQEQQLQELLVLKQEIATQLLKIRLQERVVQNLQLNRLGNRVTYRDLTDQLQKKRSIWPIRRILETYQEEVFRLAPCWLTSPETFAALFPLAPVFDIIIFDEASQCYAERAIPALARANQVIVVGDGQQLPPNSLYQVKYQQEDEDEESPDLNSESLLDLALRHCPDEWLRGHYRSRHGALVNFSNENFYGGKLTFLPKVDDLLHHKRPFEVFHIKTGTWKQNANLPEAEATVQYVFEHVSTWVSEGKEAGIVTFNQPQQELIQELLEQQAWQRGIALPSWLFVKNLEHVQGDERDIIIFSMAYGPDAAGKVRTHFGSLNMQGGENRLNVAVTRAKEKMILFTSIMPHELAVENALHRGPKLLKAWLEYVWSWHNSGAESYMQPANGHEVGNTTLARRLGAELGLKPASPFADLAQWPEQEHGDAEAHLTDDARFSSSLDARTEFGWLPLSLKARGWKVVRHWSRTAANG